MISVTFEEDLPHEKAHKPPREQRFEGKRDLFPTNVVLGLSVI